MRRAVMPRGPTNTRRIEDLEERVANMERRPARVAAGNTGRNLNDRLAQELKPLNDRIRALQAIVQAYETVLDVGKLSGVEFPSATLQSWRYQSPRKPQGQKCP